MSESVSDFTPRRREELIASLRSDAERYPDLADDIAYVLGRAEQPVLDSMSDFVNTVAISMLQAELRRRGSRTLG